MVTQERIDALERVHNTTPFNLEKAQAIADLCLEAEAVSEGAAIAPSGELRSALMALEQAKTDTDGKCSAGRVIELAHQHVL